MKAGQTPGLPRFQGRRRYHRFTDKEFGNGATLDNGFLVLSQIGRIAVRWSRPIEGTPKTVTLSHEADGWPVSVSCAEVPTQPLPRTGRETGIDVGLEVCYVTAHNEVRDNPRHVRKAEQALRRKQRKRARCQKGRNRRAKVGQRVAKHHQKVKRQRADFHHHAALNLLRHDDVISLDDWRVATLVRNRHLAKSISDAGWAQVRTILVCKAACAGKRVVAVPPRYTSQDGSGCGARVPKSLSTRTHVCPACGLVLDRDENAAVNILRAGQALQART